MSDRPMQIISVNVGLPRAVHWKGQIVSTGIFKQPVTGRVAVRALNLDGDAQADLSVHGGPDKAVYAYPAEHYAFWRAELPGTALEWGAFGENLTISGLHEGAVNLGDLFRVGTALLRATQPRLPCYKLGVKFGRDDIVKRFLHAGRYGVYFAVVEEGEAGAGDLVEQVYRDPSGIRVTDIARLYVSDKHNTSLMQRALEHQWLPAVWRDYFRKRIERPL